MTTRCSPAFLTALLLVALLAQPVIADVVHLKNGGQIEGTVTEEGDAYVVAHRFGSLTIKKADVVSIEKKETIRDLYAKKRSAIDEKDADQLVALGKWCRENGWESQALSEFRAALAIDPDNRAAHGALGHVYYEGEWRTEREIMQMRGFVLHGGKWVTKEEADRLTALAREERLARDFEKKLNRLFRKMAGGSDNDRQRAHDEVVTIAKEIGDEGLEKFAGDVKAYYDQAWQLARSQLAIMEIRAQMSTLKRPIPTIQTSLGAGSTPVTIQLPEMSVVSLGTTAVVPAGR